MQNQACTDEGVGVDWVCAMWDPKFNMGSTLMEDVTK